MVHWGWIIAAFIVGSVFGACICVCIACCMVAKAADEEEHDYFDHYVTPAQ